MGGIDVSILVRTVELMTNRYFILFGCVLLASVGHVLFKSTAQTLKGLDSFWGLAFDPTFIFALCLYGVTTMGWIWCLQEIPLSRAYLFLSLGYVFIPLMSWFYFGEMISYKYLLSVGLIVSGIMVAAVK